MGGGFRRNTVFKLKLKNSLIRNKKSEVVGRLIFLEEGSGGVGCGSTSCMARKFLSSVRKLFAHELEKFLFYRPQRSCGQGNIFTPVCHSVHRGEGVCLSACWDTPPGADTPPGTENRHPPGADTPQSRHTPRTKPPPREAESSIRSTSGRYASYWNAFLLFFISILQ